MLLGEGDHHGVAHGAQRAVGPIVAFARAPGY
jgi:hypothetical protein